MAEVIAATYEILEKIGSGGGGIVYLANHLRLNKKVILKADKRHMNARPELLRREVDVLKNLTHAYIPKVYDFFVENETVYTVMDFIEGESLDKPLKRGERFSQPQIVKWARQLLEALDYLHSPTHGDPPKGYVHSDIKPANIMITPYSDICLIDFNIALALGEENVIGRSAGYSSPEHYGIDYSSGLDGNETGSRSLTAVNTSDRTVLASEEDSTKTVAATGDEAPRSDTGKRTVVPDVRSDIYSVGAVLYHLCSGQRPAKDAKEVAPLSGDTVSPQIALIITKAMSLNPNDRYQTAAEMLYAFEHLHDNDPRVRRFKRARATAFSLTGILLAAGIFTSFVGLKRIQSSDSSLKLSEFSQNAMEKGDTASAIRYAYEAVPTAGIFTPPPSSQAELALSSALGVYDLSDGYKAYKTLTLPSEPLSLALSPDGRTGAALCSGRAVIFDVYEAEIVKELPASTDTRSQAVFLDNERVIYSGQGGINIYDTKSSSDRRLTSHDGCFTVSGDKSKTAVLDKSENTAFLVDIQSGREIAQAPFGDRKTSRIYNDIFVNASDSIFELNNDGTSLAVSFSDGSLGLYSLDSSGEAYDIIDSSYGFKKYSGGFYGQYLAFSASADDISVFAVIDCLTGEQTGGFQSDERTFSTRTNSDGIYICADNFLSRIDPVTGSQTALISTAEKVRSFATDSGYTVISSDSAIIFFDSEARQTNRLKCGLPNGHLCISGTTALAGGNNSPEVRIMKYDECSESNIISYDTSYPHDEARVDEMENTFMLFSISGFRIYDLNSDIIAEHIFDDCEQIHDQRYIRDENGSYLNVIYRDGRICDYSAKTGELIRERSGEVPDMSLNEVFYTDSLRIEAPLHGAPVVYDIKTGIKVAELEEDAYITYVTQAGTNIIAQYITTDGYVYGTLMNEKCETIARLPYLCDVYGNTLVFDQPNGYLRKTRIYTLSELKKLAEEKMTEE